MMMRTSTTPAASGTPKTAITTTTWAGRCGALAAILAALLSSSCMTVHLEEFDVDAINTREEPVPCAILRNGELVVDESSQPVITPAHIRLRFPEGGPEAGVRIEVRPVVIEDGAIARGLDEDDEAPYLADERVVRPNDAPRQLFVVRRNRDYTD